MYLNIGSAVLPPAVFRKARTACHNPSRPATRFTTVNLDYIRHYRPTVNVVDRPAKAGGRGFHITGHHALMVPLLAVALPDGLAKQDSPTLRYQNCLKSVLSLPTRYTFIPSLEEQSLRPKKRVY